MLKYIYIYNIYIYLYITLHCTRCDATRRDATRRFAKLCYIILYSVYSISYIIYYISRITITHVRTHAHVCVYVTFNHLLNGFLNTALAIPGLLIDCINIQRGHILQFRNISVTQVGWKILRCRHCLNNNISILVLMMVTL